MTLELYQERPTARPWLIAGVTVLVLHAGGVAALLVRFFDPPPLPAPPPAILIDLEPLPVPELPQEALPVPQEVPPVDLKPPPPEPEVVPEPPKPVEPPKVELPPPPAPPPPVIEREVAVPLPPPPPPPKPKPKPVVKPKTVTPPPPVENPLPPVVDAPPPVQAPPPSTSVAQAADPLPPLPVVKPQAVLTWQDKLNAHLLRYKRYGERALERGMAGQVRVYFSMDREGNLVEYRLLKSSGVSVLDQAAKTLFERASPFPPPPPEEVGLVVWREIEIPFVLK